VLLPGGQGASIQPARRRHVQVQWTHVPTPSWFPGGDVPQRLADLAAARFQRDKGLREYSVTSQ
jgi:hypothetical protein